MVVLLASWLWPQLPAYAAGHPVAVLQATTCANAGPDMTCNTCIQPHRQRQDRTRRCQRQAQGVLHNDDPECCKLPNSCSWRGASVSKARREAKDVGWLVGIAVVTPQAFGHAERVGRPFKQLGKLLVVEMETSALCRLGAGFPCGGVCLVGGARQYRRRGQYRHLRVYNELRMLLIPAGRPFVGMSDAQYRGFVEWPAKDLQPERQAVGAEAVTDLDRWLAGDVGGGEQVRFLPERQAPMRIQTRRFALARADEGIVLTVQGCHLGDHPTLLTGSLHIVIGGKEHGGQRAGAEVSAEIARSGHEILLVYTKNFRLSNDHLDVEVVLQRTHATVLNLGAEVL